MTSSTKRLLIIVVSGIILLLILLFAFGAFSNVAEGGGVKIERGSTSEIPWVV